MSYDVAAVRAHIPALSSGIAFFDGPGGSQTPDVVAAAIAATLTGPLANVGANNPASLRASEIVVAARGAMADFTGTEPGGIAFGRSMTQLCFDVSRALARDWAPGDEIAVTRLDHDAHVRPWVIAAERAGATIRWIDFDAETSELGAADVEAVLSGRTRVVAITGASNLIGTRPDLAAIAPLVHDAGALLSVDAVHLAAHVALDWTALGADLLFCSPYKFLGPHCGVLAGDPALLERIHPDKLLPSPDTVPERFELGTLPYELLAGTTAAVDFLASLAGPRTGAPAEQVPAGADRRARLVAAMAAIEAHEDGLRAELERGLAALGDEVVVRSRAARRTPTLLLTFPGHDAGTVADALAADGVNAPRSSFYALEASRRLGLQDGGGLRVGLAPYTDASDVERLLASLGGFLAR